VAIQPISDVTDSESRHGRLRLVTLEVLHLALVLLSGLPGFERPEIFALMGLWIDLSRIETILARLQLTDHGSLLGANKSFGAVSVPGTSKLSVG
jgi:hypothetical protein